VKTNKEGRHLLCILLPDTNDVVMPLCPRHLPVKL